MSLSSLLIGYRPVIDRDRRIMALQVRFAALGEEPMRLSELYRLMAGDRPLQSHTLLLSAPQAEFDAGLSDLEPTPGLWLEVPATVAEDPEHQQMLLLLHDRGMGMVLQGTPATQLPEELQAVFRLAMVDIEDERRGKEGETDTGLIRPRTRRNTAVVQSGVDSLPLMEQAFSMGAYAVCGWQIPPLVPSDSAVGSADYTAKNGKIKAPYIAAVECNYKISGETMTISKGGAMTFKLKKVSSPTAKQMKDL